MQCVSPCDLGTFGDRVPNSVIHRKTVSTGTYRPAIVKMWLCFCRCPFGSVPVGAGPRAHPLLPAWPRPPPRDAPRLRPSLTPCWRAPVLLRLPIPHAVPAPSRTLGSTLLPEEHQMTVAPILMGGLSPVPPGGLSPVPPGGLSPVPPGGLSPVPPGGLSPVPPGGLSQVPPGGLSPVPPGGLSPVPPGGLSPVPPGGLSPVPPGGLSPVPPGGLSPAPPVPWTRCRTWRN